MEAKLPVILSNLPEGKDLFEAQSHNKIANTISLIINKQHEIIDKQIIGLEGDWGIGKSNIVKMLQDQMGDDYYHFIFDTWTHQEDLTRKSMLQELITFLNDKKVIDISTDKWKEKENELSQKSINRTVRYFPRIKIYYIFFVFALFIIKIGNEMSKKYDDNRFYGFYQNIPEYLQQKSKIDWMVILKLVPYLLFLIAFISFVCSFVSESKRYVKGENETRWNAFISILGRVFYWVSGEKIQNDSYETIKEKEPSNQNFRSFLYDIDKELIHKGKSLIFTIDNADRLSDIKQKNIWSIINIFFAENNEGTTLKNIWLIIPFDRNKILDEMGDNGKGLLEKTFALSITVPPPLLSNFESFFESNFLKAFKNVEKIKYIDELQYITKILQSEEEQLAPRQIINFINQLSAYYIQCPNIPLRYIAIFIRNNEKIIRGNIINNILNKDSYINKFQHLFVDDERVEINLAKIVYGLDNDKEAMEVLLNNTINDVLYNRGSINKTTLEIPSFQTYFTIVFEKFVDEGVAVKNDNINLLVVRNFLIDVESAYKEKSLHKLYDGLWEKFCELLAKYNFTEFNEIHKSVIDNCNKNTIIKILNRTINYTFFRDGQVLSADLLQREITQLLEQIYDYLYLNNSIKFEELFLPEMKFETEFLLRYMKEKPEYYNRFNFFADDNELKSVLIGNKRLNIELISDYPNEINQLIDKDNLNALINDISRNWHDSEFVSVSHVNAYLFFYIIYRTEWEISIENLSYKSYQSILELTNSKKINIDYNLYLLLLINYNFQHINNSQNDFMSKIDIPDNIEFIDRLKEDLFKYSKPENTYKFFAIPIDLYVKESSLKGIRRLMYEVIKHPDFILCKESFNWLIQNYSAFIEYTSEFGNFSLYNKLNKYCDDFTVDIEKIDLTILNKSKRKLNAILLNNALKYLENKNGITLWNDADRDYQLLRKLIENNKISGVLAGQLINPFRTLLTRKVPSLSDQKQLLIDLKNILPKASVVSSLIGAMNNHVNFGRTADSLKYLIPEIHEAALQSNNIQSKTKLITLTIGDTSLYTTNFIDLLIANPRHLSTLKANLNNMAGTEVFSYAKEKGII